MTVQAAARRDGPAARVRVRHAGWLRLRWRGDRYCRPPAAGRQRQSVPAAAVRPERTGSSGKPEAATATRAAAPRIAGDQARRLIDLPWESRFVEQLPGDPETRNFTRPVRNVCYSEVRPTPVARPAAARVGRPTSRPSWASREPAAGRRRVARTAGGNRVPPGMRPYAARYGGHQFGQWAGQLGDGRAITLGEVAVPPPQLPRDRARPAGVPAQGGRADALLPARRRPGRPAVVSLREFLCSEAMHFLGVPTTRALSLVATGDAVVRDMFYDGNPDAGARGGRLPGRPDVPAVRQLRDPGRHRGARPAQAAGRLHDRRPLPGAGPDGPGRLRQAARRDRPADGRDGRRTGSGSGSSTG